MPVSRSSWPSGCQTRTAARALRETLATCRCGRAFTSSSKVCLEPKAATSSANSVSVSLQPAGGAVAELLRGGRFAEGCRGWLEPKQDLQGKKALAVYIEPGASLKAATTYEVVVAAGVADKPASSAAAGRWSFTTETAQAVHRLNFALDLTSDPVRWHGRFFSGICNVLFCTQAANYGPTYDLMAEARKQHPNAWSFQRDFWMTGTEFRPQGFFPVNLPNIVRERETRRIAAIESRDEGILLRVEDFFGHRQYGIADGRPVGEDYHPGDEVLIADGAHDAAHQGHRRGQRGGDRHRCAVSGAGGRVEDRL